MGRLTVTCEDGSSLIDSPTAAEPSGLIFNWTVRPESSHETNLFPARLSRASSHLSRSKDVIPTGKLPVTVPVDTMNSQSRNSPPGAGRSSTRSATT